MTNRERFQAVMGFRPFDRLPVLEWAEWWDATILRWHGEGLPAAVTGRYDICRYFGLDMYRQDWVQVRGAACPKPPSHGAGILRDENDYERLLPHLFPEAGVDRSLWEQWGREQERGESVLWFTVEGFFWFPRELFGIENHLYAFADHPALMHRMNEDLARWICLVIDDICSVCSPDFMTFAEDMSYNHGPMLSKALFDEFMLPYYRQVVLKLKERGIIPFIDSDGDISMPAAWFEEAGLEGVLPLERQAGVDLTALRRTHPQLRFMGHFDKMVMTGGEAAIRAEFERLLPLAAAGGFIVGCDHQTPPGVSLDDYRLYLSLFREYADAAGELSRAG
ncbi:hypothetical protein JXO52_00235 [bacterium]|nr:hypothetical protein [bacterium]